jgi:hypothetical protein
MDPVEPIIHSFLIKVWQEVYGGHIGPHVWRGYITHVASGTRRYFEDLAGIADFVGPHLEPMPWVGDRLTEGSDVAGGSADDDEAESGAERSTSTTAPPPPGPRSSQPMSRLGRAEMESSDNSVRALTTRLQEGGTAIDEAMDSLSRSQAELTRLTGEQAALQKVVDDLAKSTASIASQIELMAKPLADALHAHDDLVVLVGERLNETQRRAVVAAVKAVDDDIEAVRAARDAARNTVAEAQTGADLAITANAERTEAVNAAQLALTNLPATLQALQDKATKLAAAANAAVDAGHPATAFVRGEELARILDELVAKTESTYVADLQDAVAAAWKDLAASRLDTDHKSAALAPAKAALDQADAELAAKTGQRDAAVLAKVTELESRWAAADEPVESAAGAVKRPRRASAYDQAQDSPTT